MTCVLFLFVRRYTSVYRRKPSSKARKKKERKWKTTPNAVAGIFIASYASKPIHYLFSCFVVFLLLSPALFHFVFFSNIFSSISFFAWLFLYRIFHSINFVFFFSRAHTHPAIMWHLYLCTFYLYVCVPYYDEFMIMLDARVLIIIIIFIIVFFVVFCFQPLALSHACTIIFLLRIAMWHIQRSFGSGSWGEMKRAGRAHNTFCTRIASSMLA